MEKLTCSAPGCDRDVYVKNRMLCRADYALWHRKGSTRLDVTRRDNLMDTELSKACVKCSVVLPRSDFYRSKRSKDGFRGECISCMKAVNRASYSRNREKTLARQRLYEATPARMDYIANYRTSYYVANRDKFSEASAERRARFRRALRDTDITLAALREKAGDACHFCDRTMLFGKQSKGSLNPLMATIEHLQPLARGGYHSWENVRLSCLRCNTSKNAKTEKEFFAYMSKEAGYGATCSALPELGGL